MPKLNIRDLLTRGLGFCCPWAALEANRHISSEMLGRRIGVSGRAVRYVWESVSVGETKCEHCRNCMKGKLDARAAKNV